MPNKKPKRELVELYLRFQWLLNSLKDLPTAELLSTPGTEALLAEIAQAWGRREPYPIYKLLLRNDLGHVNTLRKRIHQLEAAGFVEFRAMEDDARVKLVVPTQKALQYFSDYAALIREVGR